MNVSSFLVVHPQPAKLIQPSEGLFRYPASAAQSTTILRVTLSKQRLDAPRYQTLPNHFCVVCTITKNPIRTKSRSASGALQWRDVSWRDLTTFWRSRIFLGRVRG